VVIAYLAVPGASMMRSKLLVWVGRRSYGIYLIHEGVLEACANQFSSMPRAAHNLIALAITIPLAELSYRYVEQPFLRIKRTRFSRTPAVAPQAGELALDTSG
jgi:peptidoglycan/LPS O-acetylase OafA/YrhL